MSELKELNDLKTKEDNKQLIWQREYDLDNFEFTIEALEFKITQIEKSIKMELPLKNALDDLYKNRKALEIQKTLVIQIKKGLKELNKKEKKNG